MSGSSSNSETSESAPNSSPLPSTPSFVSSLSFLADEKRSEVLRQIQVDVLRTSPTGTGSFFQHPCIQVARRLHHVYGWQASLERVLFIWALRHPASGYVQVTGYSSHQIAATGHQ
jgi:predicted oxidoreductase